MQMLSKVVLWGSLPSETETVSRVNNYMNVDAEAACRHRYGYITYITEHNDF